MQSVIQLHDYAERAAEYAQTIDEACQENNYSQLCTYVQICRESEFLSKAESGVGAIGIAQIMPDTAKDWDVDATDPHAAIRALVFHMKDYRTRYRSYPLALACYNAGEGSVMKYHGIPPYAETVEYARICTATVANALPFWPDFWRGLLDRAT